MTFSHRKFAACGRTLQRLVNPDRMGQVAHESVLRKRNGKIRIETQVVHARQRVASRPQGPRSTLLDGPSRARRESDPPDCAVTVHHWFAIHHRCPVVALHPMTRIQAPRLCFASSRSLKNRVSSKTSHKPRNAVRCALSIICPRSRFKSCKRRKDPSI